MKERIRTLDGLRGVAILLVVAGHTFANLEGIPSAWRHWLVAFANPGAGVRLFFVLSGYLITTLLLEESDRSGTISIVDFYRRRVLRIFPAFYVYLACLLAATAWFPTGINWETLLAAGTFTWNYQALWVVPPPEGFWNLGHLWTLALEQQFYLIWPAMFLYFGRRHALMAALALVLWCPIARVSTYYLFPEQRGLIGMMLHTAIDSIMAGCAAALLCRVGSWKRQIIKSGGIAAVASILWLGLLSPLLAELIRGFPVALGYSIDAMAAAFLVVWVHHAPPPSISRYIGRGVLPRLGTISYSLYLWQQPFLSPGVLLNAGYLMLALCAALTGAMLSYRYVERPAYLRRTRLGLSDHTSILPNL